MSILFLPFLCVIHKNKIPLFADRKNYSANLFTQKSSRQRQELFYKFGVKK